METVGETIGAILSRFRTNAIKAMTTMASRVSNASVFTYCISFPSWGSPVRARSPASPETLCVLGFPAFLCRTDVNAFYIKTPFSIRFLHRNCRRNCRSSSAR